MRRYIRVAAWLILGSWALIRVARGTWDWADMVFLSAAVVFAAVTSLDER